MAARAEGEPMWLGFSPGFFQVPDPETARDVSKLMKPLEAMFRSCGTEQKQLLHKLQALRRENQQLELRNHELEQEKWMLQSREMQHGVAAKAPHEAEPEVEPPRMHFDEGREIKIHNMEVHSVAMDPNAAKNGEMVFASASWDATVQFYDVNKSKVVKKFCEYGPAESDAMQGIYSVAFAKTADNVFGCSSCDTNVYLWSSETGKLLHKLEGHKEEVNDIDFHSSQQVMCTASDDNSAIIWDFQEGKVLRKLDKHTQAVYGSSFLGTDNQYLLATCCFDMNARVWDIRDKQLVAMVKLHTDDIIGIDYSNQQGLLATGSDDGLIAVWDARTWRKQVEINTRTLIEENAVKRVKWSPCGNYLAAPCSTNQVLVYQINRNESGQPPLVARLEGHQDCVFDVTWGECPGTNKKVLVSASHDHTSRCWTEVDKAPDS